MHIHTHTYYYLHTLYTQAYVHTHVYHLWKEDI